MLRSLEHRADKVLELCCLLAYLVGGHCDTFVPMRYTIE